MANANPGTDSKLLRRFTAAGEEDAFAALVVRHGPLVLSVCRRLLGDVHDAEDAFQATFLLLARQAGSIRKPDSLASWLYGVAYRLAGKMRSETARRRLLEKRAAAPASADPAAEVTWRELRTVLDEELNELPDHYRVTFLLCYEEGKTQDEAARQLGWPRGTLKRRLERARDLLRGRLLRRGITLSAALIALGLAPRAASAAVSASLVAATVKALASVPRPQGPVGGDGAEAASWAERVVQAVAAARAGLLLALVVVWCLLPMGPGECRPRAWAEPPAVPCSPEPPRQAGKEQDPRPEWEMPEYSSDPSTDPMAPRVIA
jgi:RNA polymerase sigma-70 factor (ECF subfamily)